MQIQNFTQKSPQFTGMWNNKTVLKGLEKISEHGTSFAAGTSLAMSLTVRPLAIHSTPNVEKENKQYAIANSIGSGLMKFALVEAVALPIENAVKNIDKNPNKYLKESTIQNLTKNSSELVKSKSYKLGAQIMKLGAGLVTAIPKSVFTIALIPIIMDKLFNQNSHTKSKKNHLVQEKASKIINFTGKVSDKISKGIGKIFDNEKFQTFVNKNSDKEKDIAKHMSAGTDVLLTSMFAFLTNKSKDIKENRKKALIYNNVISTAVTLLGGYGIDRAIEKHNAKFINKFSKINANDPKLHKYIEGLHIVRPAIIFAGIYYGILPMFSTYIAERVDKFVNKQQMKQHKDLA